MGRSCLEETSVKGCSLDPEPPAKIIPFLLTFFYLNISRILFSQLGIERENSFLILSDDR